jgi:transcriptional regulator with XRE-family HTH domain
MATRERLSDMGTARGRWLARHLGDELRQARLAAGLSQARVAAAAGIGQPTISRIELGRPPHPDVVVAARVARIVGLELRMACFPAAGQLRDVAHVALIGRFVARLPPSAAHRLEAPVAPHDQRAWDVLVTLGDSRIGVVAETRIRDLQGLLRREHRKQLDGGVDTLLLLVARTKNNNRALDEASVLLAAEFPVRTRAAFAALHRGQPPRANAIVVM